MFVPNEDSTFGRDIARGYGQEEVWCVSRHGGGDGGSGQVSETWEKTIKRETYGASDGRAKELLEC